MFGNEREPVWSSEDVVAFSPGVTLGALHHTP